MELKFLPGTLEFHSVANVHLENKVQEGLVSVRRIACFCPVCCGEKTGLCPNSDYTDPPAIHSLFTGKVQLPANKKVATSSELPITQRLTRNQKKRQAEAEPTSSSKRRRKEKEVPVATKPTTRSKSKTSQNTATRQVVKTESVSRTLQSKVKRKADLEPETCSKKKCIGTIVLLDLTRNTGTNNTTKTYNSKKRERGKIRTNENEFKQCFKGPTTNDKEIARLLIHCPMKEKQRLCQCVELPEVPALRKDLSIVETGHGIDKSALHLRDSMDIPGISKFPTLIKGDGNCLPRCGSMIAYGTEEYHGDMRARIAIELITFRDVYLDSEYLSRGWPKSRTPLPSATSLAMYSDFYMPVERALTAEDVGDIYDREINELLHYKSFMGMWQLFALSSVLGCPLVSVYPPRGDRAAVKDMNRLILPRIRRDQEPRFIMWSSCRSDMTDEYWCPNHFVLLAPLICTTETATVEECFNM